MNRRGFVAALLSGSAAGALAAAAVPKGERPLTSVRPHCPRCNCAALFDKPVRGNEYRWEPHQVWRVVCLPCGWVGESPLYVELPK